MITAQAEIREQRTFHRTVADQRTFSDRYSYADRQELEQMVKHSIDRDDGTRYTLSQVREELAALR